MADDKQSTAAPQQTHTSGTEPEVVALRGPYTIKSFPAHPSNYAQRAAARKIDFIVIHCTDGHEGFKDDDNTALMFSRPLKPKERSAHYVVDSDSVTQCVPERSIAYHCGRAGNARSLGVELCGRAAQSRAEWLDALSLPMLCIAARLVADKCREHALPARFIDAAALRAGLTGITTHAEVGKAWAQTTHTDPGPYFPMDKFIAAVAMATGATSAK